MADGGLAREGAGLVPARLASYSQSLAYEQQQMPTPGGGTQHPSNSSSTLACAEPVSLVRTLAGNRPE
jgi:hypothetical protein